jgi:hypothetical protein
MGGRTNTWLPSPVRIVVVSTPRKREQLPQHPKRRRGNALSALPLCFNADVSLPRLLFLVSPTCEVCVAGAISAAETVLSLPRAASFRLYILWLPVLEADTPHAAEQVQVRLPADDRLGHFWDHDLRLSRAYHRVLQLGLRSKRHRVVWDVFLLYGAGIVWDDMPPVPEFWMHQLFLEDVPKLDATVLRGQLERRIHGGTEQMDLST